MRVVCFEGRGLRPNRFTLPSEYDQVTARERLLALLADGGWHSRPEVEGAGVHYPDAWIRVLRDSGYEVEANEQGFRLLGHAEAPEPEA